MTGNLSFTGVLNLRIYEALELDQVPKVRSSVITSIKVSSIDPYLQVNIDDENLYQTQKQVNTFSPEWNEVFQTNLKDAKKVSFTVFHDSIVGGGSFVSNSEIPLQEIIDEGQSDLWVSVLFLLLTILQQFKFKMCLSILICYFLLFVYLSRS